MEKTNKKKTREDRKEERRQSGVGAQRGALSSTALSLQPRVSTGNVSSNSFESKVSARSVICCWNLLVLYFGCGGRWGVIDRVGGGER